jgi:type IV pilus assembly protein PilE
MNTHTNAHGRQGGFNLVELMVVVVVVGILAAFAYPNYQEYTRRAKRVECEGVMMSMAATLERRFSATQRYDVATGTSIPAATCPAGGAATQTYTFTTSTINTSSFTLKAKPVGGQASDKCGTLTLTEVGVKGVTDAVLAVTECWR